MSRNLVNGERYILAEEGKHVQLGELSKSLFPVNILSLFLSEICSLPSVGIWLPLTKKVTPIFFFSKMIPTVGNV